MLYFGRCLKSTSPWARHDDNFGNCCTVFGIARFLFLSIVT